MRRTLPLLALIAFCGSSPAAAQLTALAPAQASPAPPSDLVQGFSRERLQRIAVTMKRLVDANEFPGAVTLIARRGEVVHFDAVGFRDQAKTKSIAKDSLFRLASMTKPI